MWHTITGRPARTCPGSIVDRYLAPGRSLPPAPVTPGRHEVRLSVVGDGRVPVVLFPDLLEPCRAPGGVAGTPSPAASISTDPVRLTAAACDEVPEAAHAAHA